MKVQSNASAQLPRTQLPAAVAAKPATPVSASDAVEISKEPVDLDWKAIGKAALTGATVGAASSAMGALGDSLRAPGAGVRYAAVSTGSVLGVGTARNLYNGVEKTGPIQFAKAVGVGTGGLLGGAVVGGLAGTLGGLAGAVGGWTGIAVATVAGAALAGGGELVRQKVLA